MDDPFSKAGKWKIPTEQPADPPPARPAETPIEHSPGVEESPAISVPGEFTQMFGGPSCSKEAAESSIKSEGQPDPGSFAPVLHTPAQGNPSAGVEGKLPPGEFTRIFPALEGRSEVEGSTSRSPNVESTPKGSAPGEFTGLFRSPEQSKPAMEDSLTVGTAVPSDEFSGQFARVFRSTALDASPARHRQWEGPGPPLATPQGQATEVFEIRSSQPEVPRQPVLQGPSEYTRIIATPGSSPAEPESEERRADPAQPYPPKPVSLWPLIVILNVLFLLALGLVLYFAIRH